MPNHFQQEPCTIHIKNLRLRTYIGFNSEERKKRQDIVVNIVIHYDSRRAAFEDSVKDALDYKRINKRIAYYVEDNRFLLLEKLTQDILDIVMEAPQVLRASVEVDKPHALRFADSVSVIQAASRQMPWQHTFKQNSNSLLGTA